MLKLPLNKLTSGMVVVQRNLPGWEEEGEPEIFRHTVKEVGPSDYLQVNYVDGGRMMARNDHEVEVEIPGFVEFRVDICGCEWIVVEGDSPVGVDAVSDEYGYIRTTRCGDSAHHDAG